MLIDAAWRGAEQVAAEQVGGDAEDRDNAASEPQRTLFSRAEFMAEWLIETGRRPHEAPRLSLFEWALERERDAGLVGAIGEASGKREVIAKSAIYPRRDVATRRSA